MQPSNTIGSRPRIVASAAPTPIGRTTRIDINANVEDRIKLDLGRLGWAPECQLVDPSVVENLRDLLEKLYKLRKAAIRADVNSADLRRCGIRRLLDDLNFQSRPASEGGNPGHELSCLELSENPRRNIPSRWNTASPARGGASSAPLGIELPNLAMQVSYHLHPGLADGERVRPEHDSNRQQAEHPV